MKTARSSWDCHCGPCRSEYRLSLSVLSQQGRPLYLSALIEREVAPLLAAGDELIRIPTFEAALKAYIDISIQHQMNRPKLAKLIDVAETREAFQHQVSRTSSRLQAVVEKILTLPEAPTVADKSVAAADVIAILRSLIDAAGKRDEGKSNELMQRAEGAALGYLRV